MVLITSMRVCFMHSFDRFYVVTKFILPLMGDLKFSNLNYDNAHVHIWTVKMLKIQKQENIC